jgi:hypothetical protein
VAVCLPGAAARAPGERGGVGGGQGCAFNECVVWHAGKVTGSVWGSCMQAGHARPSAHCTPTPSQCLTPGTLMTRVRVPPSTAGISCMKFRLPRLPAPRHARCSQQRVGATSSAHSGSARARLYSRTISWNALTLRRRTAAHLTAIASCSDCRYTRPKAPAPSLHTPPHLARLNQSRLSFARTLCGAGPTAVVVLHF